MDYYENGDLRSFIKNADNYSKLDKNIIIKWMLQLLYAISHIHKHNIIHRDLKLDNCFIDKDLNLYLGDFGMAKSIDNT